MGKLFKVLFSILIKAVMILAIAVGILFVIYFWNLDQKFLGWVYSMVNRIFERKKSRISDSDGAL